MNPLVLDDAPGRHGGTALSVNVNKIALLRNTRHLGIPSVVRAATLCLEAGADGITVHPRPDERHIRGHDVHELAALMKAWPQADYNIEGNPFHNLMDFIRAVRPHQATFVPDGEGQFTSDHGWDLQADGARVKPLIDECHALGVRVSLFMDAEPDVMAMARAIGADRVELYTEPYAAAHGTPQQATQLARFAAAARAAQAAGLGVNAGHDLNQPNLADFLRAVPGVAEVSIGHALVADALEVGLPETVRAYRRAIAMAQAGAGTMIVGVGTDICDVRRIEATLARRGQRFPERVLGPREQQVFAARRARVESRGVRFLATRFSAKEAFSKAIGLGITSPMRWRDCEILNHASGAPYIRLDGELARWFAARGWVAHVSVTDETDYAASFVVVETQPPAPMKSDDVFVQAPVVLDIAGTTLSKADRRRLQHPLTGGLILFARNWENRRQLTELTASIKTLRPDVLICVDHEGGRVQRFRSDGFTHLPPMRALGELWMKDAMAATDAASAAGHVLAAELRACGVDLSFAPVLDLDHGGSSVIGDRAFHRDARVATLLAKSVAHGMLRAGMAHCGKHFPGHGFVKADSHVAVPVDKRSLKAILADDAAPYAWLSATLTAVMPAHVVYPKVDARPAGFSPRWLQELLRGQMGFTGAIFSDDLSMEGARHLDGGSLSYAEAAAEALNAGCDLVLLCNQSVDGGEAVDALLEGLALAAAAGRWFPSPDAEQRRVALLPSAPPLAWDELMHDPAYQRSLESLP